MCPLVHLHNPMTFTETDSKTGWVLVASGKTSLLMYRLCIVVHITCNNLSFTEYTLYQLYRQIHPVELFKRMKIII